MLAYIRQYWRLAIGVGVVLTWVVLLGWIGALKVEASFKESKIIDLNNKIQEITKTNVALNSSLSAQNQTIDRLSSVTASAQATFGGLTKKIQQQSSALSANLAAIQSGPTPTDCSSAIRYLITAVPEYSK